MGRSSVLLLVLTAFAAPAHALRVDNFVLLDDQGKAHELYYHKDAPAIVIMVQGNGCPIVRSSIADFKAVRDQFAPAGVEFLMLNSNPQDDRASIRKEAVEWQIDVPILDDETQLIGESLELVRTAEVLVINPKSWDVVYRGPLNDRIQDYERQKNEASANYVADVLNHITTGKTIDVAERDTIGCLINFSAAKVDHAAISYSQTIAPMLEENCAMCHQEGGIGPWAMKNYDMVHGFAPMIREVVRTKRMPPWHADPEVGTWKEDRSLSVEQVQTLVHWVEAGAPRGTGADPLAARKPTATEWPLGEPDLVIEIPAYEVPATGVVDYKFPVVKNPLDRDIWVTSATVVPGDRQVVHHILVGSTETENLDEDREGVFENYIIGYAPGNESTHMPDRTGVFVKAGGYYQFQLHYTPYGKATTDRSKIGLYLADPDERPANFMRTQVVLDPTIEIPAGAPDHEEVSYVEFDKDAVIYSLVPHSHYRGKASSFELVYPDGKTELVLSVPNYDFNWQRTYEFVEPRQIPAGTRLIHRTVYDNSKANPANPDPETTVHWGLQSWEEMLYGNVTYAWVDETADKPIHNRDLSETYQFVGFMDRDMDGKLAWSELPPNMKKRLVQGFKGVDTNGDGGLDVQEFIAMQRQAAEQRAQEAEESKQSAPSDAADAAGGR